MVLENSFWNVMENHCKCSVRGPYHGRHSTMSAHIAFESFQSRDYFIVELWPPTGTRWSTLSTKRRPPRTSRCWRRRRCTVWTSWWTLLAVRASLHSWHRRWRRPATRWNCTLPDSAAKLPSNSWRRCSRRRMTWLCLWIQRTITNQSGNCRCVANLFFGAASVMCARSVLTTSGVHMLLGNKLYCHVRNDKLSQTTRHPIFQP